MPYHTPLAILPSIPGNEAASHSVHTWLQYQLLQTISGTTDQCNTRLEPESRYQDGPSSTHPARSIMHGRPDAGTIGWCSGLLPPNGDLKLVCLRNLDRYGKNAEFKRVGRDGSAHSTFPTEASFSRSRNASTRTRIRYQPWEFREPGILEIQF